MILMDDELIILILIFITTCEQGLYVTRKSNTSYNLQSEKIKWWKLSVKPINETENLYHVCTNSLIMWQFVYSSLSNFYMWTITNTIWNMINIPAILSVVGILQSDPSGVQHLYWPWSASFTLLNTRAYMCTNIGLESAYRVVIKLFPSECTLYHIDCLM